MPEREPDHAFDIHLLPFAPEHGAEAVGIYNHYVQAGTAAFAQEPVADDFFDFLLEMPEIYPAFILWDRPVGRVVGFCFLSPFLSQPTFRQTARIDYFLAPEYTGRGLGSLCLRRLEDKAKQAGICHIVADVSDENRRSIAFHEARGFWRCAHLENIGHKLGREFGVVTLQKDLLPAGGGEHFGRGSDGEQRV